MGSEPAREHENEVDDLDDPLVADAFADPLTSDGALVRASAAGSKQAFALLVRRYEYAAFAWTSHAFNDPALAVSACREVFRRAWQQALSSPHDVSRWLLEIAFEVAAEYGAPAAARDRDLDALWLGGVVFEAVQKLPDEERRLLLSDETVGDETARMSVLVGLQQLRELLGARGVVRQGH